MVTPTYGTAFYAGQSGKIYSVDFYVSDVNQAPATWDSGSGASSASDTFWIAPENVTLRDVSAATGPTVITKLNIVANAVSTGNRLRLANQLNSLNNRPLLGVPFRQGTKVAFIQES